MVAFLSLNFSLGLLDLKSWGPFALSIFFAICAPLTAAGFASPLRKPEAGGPGSDTRLHATRNLTVLGAIMIEAYAFCATFTVEVLAISVLIPAWLLRTFRVKAASYADERLAQLYPGIDARQVLKRFLSQYRVLTSGLAVFGLLLLGWQISAAGRADWDEGRAGLVSTGYFFVAFGLPAFLCVRLAARFSKERGPAEGKRTAILQRRGLFDFVSPFTVFAAILIYFLYAAFLIYLVRHPFPGFAGFFINIGAVTLAYMVIAVCVYITLYGKKSPLETHAGRQHTIGLAVKGFVYSGIVMIMSISLSHTFRLLDLKSWEPFAGCVFWAIFAVLSFMGFASPLRKPEEEPA